MRSALTFLFSFFAIEVLFTFISVSPKAQEEVWMHNGSIMTREGAGHNWQFKYLSPRPGMRKEGASPGDTVFDGWAEGGWIEGTAYIFARDCGVFPYKATGTYSANRVIMRGQAPVVNRSSCRITGLRDDTLVFSAQ